MCRVAQTLTAFLKRAQEFAARCNDPVVWYKLGKAQLEGNSIPEAIESYLKAEDPQDYNEVIQAAEREENYEELVRYSHHVVT